MSKARDTLPNELLRYERERHAWTQEEVAERIGASDYNMIGRWEREGILPAARYRQQLMTLFGKSARELGFVRKGEISFWRIPYRQNVFFTGREEVLTQVHNALFSQSDIITNPPLAVSGTGGIGKTQIALEYAYRYSYEYHTIAWVQVRSREELSNDFSALFTLLNLSGEQEYEQPQMIQAVKDWLTAMTRWLLVFDNTDDLEMLKAFLPYPAHGHVLLTTRMHVIETGVQAIEIEPMTPEEGAGFLLRRAKLLALDRPLSNASGDEIATAKSIVEAVGGLPFALDQAGAYIEETGCSLLTYLDLYRSHRAELFT